MDKTKIKTLIKQVRGVSYKPDDLHNELNNDSVILLRANNIDDGKINFDDVVYVDKSKVSYEQYLRKGDILICASSGSKNLVGKAASVDFDRECTFGAFCKVVRPNDDVVVDYLGVYFQSSIYRRKISEAAIGANINNIRSEHIDELEVPLFSCDEQQDIVKKIKLVQDIINKRKDEISSLDDLIKARFVELFGDRYVNDKNWNTTKLGESISFNNGKAHEQVVDENGEYILVTSRAIASDFEDVRRTNTLLFPLHKNDIVMVMSDVPNGKALAKCQLIDSNDKYTLNQRICSFGNYEYNPIFLFHLLNRHPYFLSFNDGNGQTNLRKNDILECELIFPPMELQEQFAAFVHQVDKSKFEVQKSLDETQKLMDSLMQHYFG